ncbi:hypothetical protein QWZ03_14305 [Chitinimonas viridis]|uniref:Uncharacterized protein n=1 Tax=Chitinimonas viridis TaxID=664880 RepID=A0ABT8B718_9NEIS|nr:hypothetical protein [Chitinimonas viridis]MDN3577941.1 hypothetical protein [Chitinimonas viridis]
MGNITYLLRYDDGRQQQFMVDATATPPDGTNAGWMDLSFHRCRHCPLDEAEVPQCPLAVRLSHLVSTTSLQCSHEELQATVTMAARTVSLRTTAQRALSSLMGLLTATSGCPHTGFLAPMASFHLPFATERETLYRVASMYLLGQYLRQSQGQTPDWRLQGLRQAYQQLHIMNRDFAERLRAATQDDAAVNSLVLLDIMTRYVPDFIDESLNEFASEFAAYGVQPADT